MTGGVRWVVTGSTLLLLVLAACGGAGDPDTPAADGETPTTGETRVPDTGPAAELAPSQRSSPTAPPPETPPPCDPADLSLWTAQVHVRDEEVDAVIRVRNDGAAWCEVDVFASPSVDPLMEPDVWLDPGAWADLLVGPGPDACAESEVVTAVEVAVNGTPVVVPTVAVVRCGWQLVAFYPNGSSDEPCDELAAAVVDGAVVIRNPGTAPCRLGSLVSAGDMSVADVQVTDAIAVPVLAPGDLVAFATRAGTGAAGPVTLGFDSGAGVTVTLTGVDAVVGGAPRPWIGGPGSPATGDAAALVRALDPF